MLFPSATEATVFLFKVPSEHYDIFIAGNINYLFSFKRFKCINFIVIFFLKISKKKLWKLRFWHAVINYNTSLLNNQVHCKNKTFLLNTSMYNWSKKINKTFLFLLIENIVQKWSSVLIINDHCLLQFYALKFFLGVRLREGSLPNFNSFNVNPQIFQWNHKVHLLNCLEIFFHNISSISLRVIRRWN